MSEEKPQNAETSAPESSQPEIQAFSVKRVHHMPHISFAWVKPWSAKLRPAYGWARRQWKFTLPVLVVVLCGIGVGIWQLTAHYGNASKNKLDKEYAGLKVAQPVESGNQSSNGNAGSNKPTISKEVKTAPASSGAVKSVQEDTIVSGQVTQISATGLTFKVDGGKTLQLKITSSTKFNRVQGYAPAKQSDVKVGSKANLDYNNTNNEIQNLWLT